MSDFPRMVEVTAEGVELARKAGAPQNVAWLPGNLSDLIRHLAGPTDEAEAISREAVQLAELIGDEPLLGMRLSNRDARKRSR